MQVDVKYPSVFINAKETLTYSLRDAFDQQRIQKDSAKLARFLQKENIRLLPSTLDTAVQLAHRVISDGAISIPASPQQNQIVLIAGHHRTKVYIIRSERENEPSKQHPTIQNAIRLSFRQKTALSSIKSIALWSRPWSPEKRDDRAQLRLERRISCLQEMEKEKTSLFVRLYDSVLCKIDGTLKVLLFQENASADLTFYHTRIRSVTTLKKDNLHAILRKLVLAVSMLHDKGYVVRDLKPDNFLVFEHSKGTPHERVSVKLADLEGVCKRSDAEALKRPYCSVAWEAPEVFCADLDGEQGEYDPIAADIWGVGLLINHLTTGDILLSQRLALEIEDNLDEVYLSMATLDVSDGALSSSKAKFFKNLGEWEKEIDRRQIPPAECSNFSHLVDALCLNEPEKRLPLQKAVAILQHFASSP